jgi:hypothetical protein
MRLIRVQLIPKIDGTARAEQSLAIKTCKPLRAVMLTWLAPLATKHGLGPDGERPRAYVRRKQRHEQQRNQGGNRHRRTGATFPAVFTLDPTLVRPVNHRVQKTRVYAVDALRRAAEIIESSCV